VILFVVAPAMLKADQIDNGKRSKELNSCGLYQGCFGLPNNCKVGDDGNCLLEFIFEPDDASNYIKMNLHKSNVKPDQYVAVGLSKDQTMGDDVVFSCSPQERSAMNIGWNDGHSWKQVEGNTTASLGIKDVAVKYDNGNLRCSWKVPVEFRVEYGKYRGFNLKENRFYILFAYSSDQKESKLSYHSPKNRKWTENAINLSAVEDIAIAKDQRLFVLLHGIFNVLAWFGFIACGTIFPGYLRDMLSSYTLANKQLWFILHITFVGIGILLSSIALVLIAIERKYFPLLAKKLVENPHALFGVFCYVILLLQLVAGILRPSPESRYRATFNWAHRTVGVFGLIFAITAVFLAIDLPLAKLNQSVLMPTIVFTGTFIIIHILLAISRLGGETKRIDSIDNALSITYCLLCLGITISVVITIANPGNDVIDPII